MVTRSRFLSVAALLCLTAAARPVGAQSASPDAEVRAAMSGFMDALNALDADRMAAFFAPDITAFVPAAQAERVEGKDAFVRIFRAFVERTRPATSRLALVPEDLKVELSGSLAVLTFNIRDAATGLVRRRTFVWRRMEDRWLISHFHASDLAPPGRVSGNLIRLKRNNPRAFRVRGYQADATRAGVVPSGYYEVGPHLSSPYPGGWGLCA